MTHSSRNADLRPDQSQREAVRKLQALVDALGKHSAPAAPGSGASCAAGSRKREAPRGLYLWGPVGRGKTMLMNLFFDMAPVDEEAPRAFPRLHGRCA